MNKQAVALKKLDSLVLSPQTNAETNQDLALTFLSNVMPLGFVFSQELTNRISALSRDEITTLSENVIPVLREMTGAHVDHKPMYPNFPQQVINASEVELLINALLHYWSFGRWQPDYHKLPRAYAFEHTQFRTIGLASEQEFKNIFTQILQSSDSISEVDKDVVRWFMRNYSDLQLPDTIPFKENMCLVASEYLQMPENVAVRQKHDLTDFVDTCTDVMRVCAYLSGGDPSLSQPVKFKTLPRPYRRQLTRVLEDTLSEEDMKRRPGMWVRLLHNLHVGDYSQQVYGMAKKVRENQKLWSFNAETERLIGEGNVRQASVHLQKRPGEFARRLDELFKKFPDNRMDVMNAFTDVIGQVPTRMLLQVWGHFNTRGEAVTERYVFPKGWNQKAFVLNSGHGALPESLVNMLVTQVRNELRHRFAKGEKLGKVWVDANLRECPVPTQMRSVSDSLFTVARGTRLPIGEDKNTLRFFIYWKGQDIDLSGSYHDENYEKIQHISYTNLRSHKFRGYHSGDITYAPEGASEFIDVDIDAALKAGARYVVMNVYVFSGPNFADHEECFAGWMTRSQPNSNEIFDPKTVEQKADLATDSRNAIPVVFDLKERKAIWTDIVTVENHWGNAMWRSGNNIEGNVATTEQMLKFFVERNNKVSLYDLFVDHAVARGELVDSKEEADTVFSLNEGITPYNINLINSEYVAD